jgi:hypothetical protein
MRRLLSELGPIFLDSNGGCRCLPAADGLADLAGEHAGRRGDRAGHGGCGHRPLDRSGSLGAKLELAQRSGKAAKEIKALITTSGEQVQSGVSLVGDTGKALETIVGEVQEINRHGASIVVATREQATGLQEISTAVNTMDQGTQQNAAMVEEQTAASHSLAQEAAALNELLTQFKLGGAAAGFAATAPATRRAA